MGRRWVRPQPQFYSFRQIVDHRPEDGAVEFLLLLTAHIHALAQHDHHE